MLWRSVVAKPTLCRPPMTSRYQSAASIDDALAELGKPSARPLGGGTDLLVAMEAGLDQADTLVDLTRIGSLDSVTTATDGAMSIGAAVRLEQIAEHPDIRSRFPALALAAAAVGTPALRAMGTLGGNLCQRYRCWYLRSRIPCLKNGGSGCPAKDGENQYHAVLGSGPCHAAHPSDPAVALVALDARVQVRGPSGSRTLSIDELYREAASNPLSEVSLGAGEFIESVELPATSAGGTQQFTKLMQRGAWDFATVSLAGVRRADGSVRLALGGVAPMPWRVNQSVEEDVASGELDEDSVDALALRALHDARPLTKNAYKLQQAAALLTRAMFDLSRG
jgi:xanthine dehydrogenase YagS FAD-binding subunit